MPRMPRLLKERVRKEDKEGKDSADIASDCGRL